MVGKIKLYITLLFMMIGAQELSDNSISQRGSEKQFNTILADTDVQKNSTDNTGSSNTVLSIIKTRYKAFCSSKWFFHCIIGMISLLTTTAFISKKHNSPKNVLFYKKDTGIVFVIEDQEFCHNINIPVLNFYLEKQDNMQYINTQLNEHFVRYDTRESINLTEYILYIEKLEECLQVKSFIEKIHNDQFKQISTADLLNNLNAKIFYLHL